MGSVVVAQLEVPIDTVEAAFRAARRAGATTMLNPAPVPSSAGTIVAAASARAAPSEAPLCGLLPQTLVALTDVVVVNQVEAEQLAGLPVTGVVQARRAATALIEGGFGAAVVTLGDRGAVWTDAAGNGRAAAPRVKAVDTVGAGDTFVGYLASGLARGVALGESVAEAVHAAALAVTRRGAQSGIPAAARARTFRSRAGACYPVPMTPDRSLGSRSVSDPSPSSGMRRGRGEFRRRRVRGPSVGPCPMGRPRPGTRPTAAWERAGEE